jgi:hypothetical protein
VEVRKSVEASDSQGATLYHNSYLGISTTTPRTTPLLIKLSRMTLIDQFSQTQAKMSQTEAPWQSIARRKQQEQANAIPQSWTLKTRPAANRKNVLAIPRECGILSGREIEITEKYDATALVQQLVARKLKSVDVVTAFCKRAAIAQQLVRCPQPGP